MFTLKRSSISGRKDSISSALLYCLNKSLCSKKNCLDQKMIAANCHAQDSPVYNSCWKYSSKSVSVIWLADWKMLPCHYRAVHRMTDYTLVLACRNKKQVVNVIWLKVASPRRTNPLIVFARWRQCAFSSKHRLLNPNESTFNRLNSIFLVRWSTQTRSYTLPCVLSLITMNVSECR